MGPDLPGAGMPMRLPKASPAAVRRFGELVPESPDLITRMLFGQPAAFVRGNLFFGVFGEKLFVRLSDEDRAQALRTPGFATFEPMPGRAMSQYVVLPASLLKNPTLCRRWLARALDYAGGLPPRAAARRRK